MCLWRALLTDYTNICQSSVVCVLCSRLMFPYLVCFLSLLSVIIS